MDREVTLMEMLEAREARAGRQRELLEQEGVGFLPDGRADMKGFLWHPDTVSALQGQD